MREENIIIVGAGAAGLMAARELGRAGKKVVILEARDRIGGRILPLAHNEFGYPAQGGAEWVHGDAPISKALVEEAGLTLLEEGDEIWTLRNGKLELHHNFIQGNPTLKERLSSLKEDLPIQDFLERYYPGEENSNFRNSVIKMVEGYDAGDPKEVSTFTLRDEWLTKTDWNDHRIKEGYGALLKYLQEECLKNGTVIKLKEKVESIDWSGENVLVVTSKNERYLCGKVIVTVPLPVLRDIKFNPVIKEKLKLAGRIGYGYAIKIIIKFDSRIWESLEGNDLSKMAFLISNEKFLTWWTQYPQVDTVLTGWMAGPEAAKYVDTSDNDLFDICLNSLSNILKMSVPDLRKKILHYNVFNWPKDPLTKGSYSYTKVVTEDAPEKLVEPLADKIFFAGEALSFSENGKYQAIVEGALESGVAAAKGILK